MCPFVPYTSKNSSDGKSHSFQDGSYSIDDSTPQQNPTVCLKKLKATRHGNEIPITWIGMQTECGNWGTIGDTIYYRSPWAPQGPLKLNKAYNSSSPGWSICPQVGLCSTGQPSLEGVIDRWSSSRWTCGEGTSPHLRFYIFKLDSVREGTVEASPEGK